MEETFRNIILTRDTSSFFESIYQRTHDIDERNFIEGKLEAYLDGTQTFGQVAEALDFLLLKARDLNEDTMITKENWPFVWNYVKTSLVEKGAISVLEMAEKKGREYAELGTIHVAYLIALACDADRELQRELQEIYHLEETRRLDEEAKMANEDVYSAQMRRLETHPSNADQRRRLMAEAAEKRLKLELRS